VARLAAAALALTFVVPGAAAKVTPTGLRVCGSSGCTTVENARLAQSVVADSMVAGRVAPAAYVTVEVMPRSDDPWAPKPFYYVPSAHAIRVHDNSDLGQWRAPATEADSALGGAAAAVEPFSPPASLVASVDRRPVADGSSYLRLYTIAGPRRADPAGARPRTIAWTHAHQWAVYYARVRHTWAYVDLTSMPPTPWSDGTGDLWIGRRVDLLRRDGTVIALAPSLAATIRGGRALP
jgi:hypothetical protein